MPNVDAARLYRFSRCRSRLSVHVRTQFALHHRVQERDHFALYASDLKLDATVRQIPDPADHIKTLGDLANGPAEANPLNVAFVEYLERDHRMNHDNEETVRTRKHKAPSCRTLVRMERTG